ncbi:MAG: tryptophan synthase subunit alpha [Burkholderiales bacterium]|nr:tryptophan synthase subunit alpha [Phycisphaerae bacterium]
MSISKLKSRIKSFRDRDGIAVMPFVAAGFPDLETSLTLIPALERGGAAAIEVGFPFSDPIADGPTIQEAFTIALQKKLRIDDIFAGIERIKAQITIPLVAMVSYSIVYRYGLEKFVNRAHQAGFTGLLLPDLPPPEADLICRKVQELGLETVLLVSPSTSAERLGKVVSLCSGFVYYLSVAGITGERDKLPPGIEENVRKIKSISKVPVCVGFGISTPAHVRQLAGVADGAIVGSALVRRIKEAKTDLPAAAEAYCRELVGK